ncbi:Ubiquitin carboxyl-terminal hydrolase 37 [Clydaea vesicula]|uniref:Ubiquitin carboxyl-terminal hydrolase 37 n=1 Tax=Clydaea vesicula TaxID=447962 RepID=A0AAD5TYK8_9FUNG|nr:Ubiquitin carboxyl-terminal hydrolase 37 [Clydaea vesicula]
MPFELICQVKVKVKTQSIHEKKDLYKEIGETFFSLFLNSDLEERRKFQIKIESVNSNKNSINLYLEKLPKVFKSQNLTEFSFNHNLFTYVVCKIENDTCKYFKTLFESFQKYYEGKNKTLNNIGKLNTKNLTTPRKKNITMERILDERSTTLDKKIFQKQKAFSEKKSATENLIIQSLNEDNAKTPIFKKTSQFLSKSENEKSKKHFTERNYVNNSPLTAIAKVNPKVFYGDENKIQCSIPTATISQYQKIHKQRSSPNVNNINSPYLQQKLSFASIKEPLEDSSLVKKVKTESGETYHLLKTKQDTAVVSPFVLKECIGKTAKQFSGNDQQDAHEFFTEFCQLLEKDFEELNKEYATKNNSVVSFFKSPLSVFNWLIEYNLTCLDCGYFSKKVETYRDISINFPNTETKVNLSLVNLLNEFFKAEKVSYKCEKCQKSNFSKSQTILQLPKVILVQFNRFSLNKFDKDSYNKIKDYVKISEVIEFGKMPDSKKPKMMKLAEELREKYSKNVVTVNKIDGNSSEIKDRKLADDVNAAGQPSVVPENFGHSKRSINLKDDKKSNGTESGVKKVISNDVAVVNPVEHVDIEMLKLKNNSSHNYDFEDANQNNCNLNLSNNHSPSDIVKVKKRDIAFFETNNEKKNEEDQPEKPKYKRLKKKIDYEEEERKKERLMELTGIENEENQINWAIKESNKLENLKNESRLSEEEELQLALNISSEAEKNNEIIEVKKKSDSELMDISVSFEDQMAWALSDSTLNKSATSNEYSCGESFDVFNKGGTNLSKFEKKLLDSIDDDEDKNTVKETSKIRIKFDQSDDSENAQLPGEKTIVDENDTVVAVDSLEENLFKLKCIISHCGSSHSSGHYICDVKDETSMTWKTYNDDEVYEYSKEEFLNTRGRTAYLLSFVQNINLK